MQKNELVSTIDARKNDLALEQAKRVLAELEQDIKSRSASNQATISLAEEKRNKAKLAMDQAQGNIDKMRVVSPMDGLVALEKNEGAAGGILLQRDVVAGISRRRPGAAGTNGGAGDRPQRNGTRAPRWENSIATMSKKDSRSTSSSMRFLAARFMAQ